MKEVVGAMSPESGGCDDDGEVGEEEDDGVDFLPVNRSQNPDMVGEDEGGVVGL